MDYLSDYYVYDPNYFVKRFDDYDANLDMRERMVFHGYFSEEEVIKGYLMLIKDKSEDSTMRSSIALSSSNGVLPLLDTLSQFAAGKHVEISLSGKSLALISKFEEFWRTFDEIHYQFIKYILYS